MQNNVSEMIDFTEDVDHFLGGSPVNFFFMTLRFPGRWTFSTRGSLSFVNKERPSQWYLKVQIVKYDPFTRMRGTREQQMLSPMIGCVLCSLSFQPHYAHLAVRLVTCRLTSAEIITNSRRQILFLSHLMAMNQKCSYLGHISHPNILWFAQNS